MAVRVVWKWDAVTLMVRPGLSLSLPTLGFLFEWKILLSWSMLLVLMSFKIFGESNMVQFCKLTG